MLNYHDIADEILRFIQNWQLTFGGCMCDDGYVDPDCWYYMDTDTQHAFAVEALAEKLAEMKIQ